MTASHSAASRTTGCEVPRPGAAFGCCRMAGGAEHAEPVRTVAAGLGGAGDDAQVAVLDREHVAVQGGQVPHLPLARRGSRTLPRGWRCHARGHVWQTASIPRRSAGQHGPVAAVRVRKSGEPAATGFPGSAEARRRGLGEGSESLVASYPAYARLRRKCPRGARRINLGSGACREPAGLRRGQAGHCRSQGFHLACEVRLRGQSWTRWWQVGLTPAGHQLRSRVGPVCHGPGGSPGFLGPARPW